MYVCFFQINFSKSTIQGVVSGIHWKALNDSDEETSEGYDEMDEDTDEEDSNDKPGESTLCFAEKRTGPRLQRCTTILRFLEVSC